MPGAKGCGRRLLPGANAGLQKGTREALLTRLADHVPQETEEAGVALLQDTSGNAERKRKKVL